MDDERTTLDIHNMQGCVVKSISLHGFAKMEVIASGQVLVSDERDVFVTNCSDGQVQSKAVYKHQQMRSSFIESKGFFEKDSLHDYYGKTEGGKTDCLTMFSDQDGLPNPNGPMNTCMFSEGPLNTFLKEVIY